MRGENELVDKQKDKDFQSLREAAGRRLRVRRCRERLSTRC